MGSLKDQMIEDQQEKDDQQLAKVLGITVSELQELEYGFDEERSADNEGVYVELVVFKEPSPKHILAKIKGLDSDNTVRLEPGWQYQ